MESALLPEAEQAKVEEVPTPEPVAAATRPTSKLFESSGYVHIGDGAEDCEHRDPTVGVDPCTNPDHFHAWVCLPNAFQIRDIGDKARAARARKIRALKDAGDPEKGAEASDSYVTLEAELEALSESDRPRLAEQMAQGLVAKELGLILAGLAEDERFEHRDQEVEELRRQQSLPEEQQDREEIEQLQKGIDAFEQAFQDEVKARSDGEVVALMNLSWDDFIDQIRGERIERLSTLAYLNTNYAWIMFIGTRQPFNHAKRVYESLQDLKMAAPEIVSALRAKIEELENNPNIGGGQGNS
jgi:hypothetical protein